MAKYVVTPETMSVSVNNMTPTDREQFRSAVLPTQSGNAGKVLSTNGSTSYWATVSGGSGSGGGTVTSVDFSGGSTGLITTGGPVTGVGTVTLGGTLGVANGGTGATSTQSARTALLPSQSGKSGMVLSTNGTDVVWTTISSGGSGSGGSIVTSVLDFGAVGNGSTDDTQAIQRAIDSVGLAGGGVVVLPVGRYKITSNVSFKSYKNVTLRGMGKGSIIQSAMSSGNYISMPGGNSQCTISDMMITSMVAQVSGSAIYLENGHNNRLHNLVIGYGEVHTAIKLEGGTDQFIYHISDFVISTCKIGIDVGGNNLLQDVYIRDGVIGSCSTAGILMTSASGVYMSKVDIISCYDGIMTYPATGKHVTACFMTDVQCDTSVRAGWALYTGGGSVDNWNVSNCWGATCGTNGVHVDASTGVVRSISIVNFRAINNKQHGMLFEGCTGISISNSQVIANSQSGSGQYDGLAINGAKVNDITIMGCKFGDGWGAHNWQRYGVNITKASTNIMTHYTVIGNNCRGNVVGGVMDGIASSSAYVNSNLV